MRASKINVIPKVAVNMNGVTRSGRRHNDNDTKKVENTKKNEPNSPNSNSENISPIPKKRRRERESVVAEKTASPRTPRGKNGIKETKLDESKANASPLEASMKRGEKVCVEAKTQGDEVNLDGTETDLEKCLNTSFKTPTNSVKAENNELVKSHRQLRSSGKKVASDFDTPVERSTEATEVVETSKSDETNTALVAADEVAETDQIVSAQVSDAVIEKGNDNFDNFIENIQTDQDVFEKSTANDSAEEPLKTEHKLVDQEQSLDADIAKAVVKEEVLPTAAVENVAAIPIDNIKSPSVASVDSAKGSSIGTEAEYSIFFTGDLYWGQIHHFCYWPCMVCPDNTDEDQPITRMIEKQMEVHVRFFADNARHSWVKRENLLRYRGLKQYKELTNDAKEKYGESSPKCKIFFPKRSKKNVWRSAVKEADDMMNIAYAERLTTFFKMNDTTRERIREEKLRRKSLAKSNPNLSLVSSSMDTSDSSEGVKKRNRSESPPSPEYSPKRNEIKRRKTTSATDRTEFMLSRAKETEEFKGNEESPDTKAQQQQHQNALFVSPEFENLYKILKEYITRGFQCDPIIEAGIFRSARNVWAMKQLVDGKIAESGEALGATTPNSHGHKRLSMRLKDIKEHQQMQAAMAAAPSPAKSPLQVTYPVSVNRRSSTSSKPRNRPMEEVIDDIFNLDKFYLFDNVGGRAPVCKYCFKPGGVLKRCSKGCFSWLHSDCLVVSEVETNVSKNDVVVKSMAVDIKRANRRKSSLNSVDMKKIVHVTADDEAIVSVEDKQESATAEATSDENDDHKDTVVDLDASESLETASSEEEPIVCNECANDVKPQCFVCKSEKMIKPKNTKTLIKTTTDESIFVKEDLHMCNMANCGRVYHLSCLKYWPQAKTALDKKSVVSLRCPSHICHTCVSDDPKGKFQHLKDANTTKCVKCPATYHMDSTCIPAGSQVLTSAHIICPRHGILKSDQTVNVSWCFICVRGGKLLCCETCPTAVHAECTNVQLDANESYICDECESGRLPLYGEMVWAKFNVYRWWPAIILPPTEVPLNIRNKSHNPFDFVIRFFGTHDHGWISRRRVYLYVEGDWSDPPKSKRLIDQNYLRGVIEAREAYEIIKQKTSKRDTQNENKELLHPHPYVKIRVNRAVPPVKLHQDIETVSKCGCDPNEANPCGHDTDCLNRVLYHECNPKVCPAGERCQNQMFESRISPALEVFYAKKERGFGLRCLEAISSGTFIIEYVGEVINSEEFRRRLEQKSADRDENYYFLYVEKDYIIDAGPKGNMARFMNHSCDPNCETQKWSVNGLNRVGLFAIKDIPANTELTFNYHWDELLGNDKKVCCCGSTNCTGQIGKVSKEETKRKQVIEATTLTKDAESFKINKVLKLNSSSQKKLKGKKNPPSSANKKQKKPNKKKRRATVAASPTTSVKVTELNDDNNNI